MTMKRTPEPFTPEQARIIRSMAVYWHEVRTRKDTSPLWTEAQTLLHKLSTNSLLLAAEFCADPVRRSAYDLLEICEQILHTPGEVHTDASVTVVLPAALATALRAAVTSLGE